MINIYFYVNAYIIIHGEREREEWKKEYAWSGSPSSRNTHLGIVHIYLNTFVFFGGWLSSLANFHKIRDPQCVGKTHPIYISISCYNEKCNKWHRSNVLQTVGFLGPFDKSWEFKVTPTPNAKPPPLWNKAVFLRDYLRPPFRPPWALDSHDWKTFAFPFGALGWFSRTKLAVSFFYSGGDFHSPIF